MRKRTEILDELGREMFGQANDIPLELMLNVGVKGKLRYEITRESDLFAIEVQSGVVYALFPWPYHFTLNALRLIAELVETFE